ncbi:hypothetical protein RND81_04G081900 [Saponaria officinalis]|uniref:Uncharacterized protein n=1 Tax=Saponaria officinalis TaxID=3572 RepID=A0AAW1LDG2_SAPOF
MAKITSFSVLILAVSFLLSMSLFPQPADASEKNPTGLEIGKWSENGQCRGTIEECNGPEIRRSTVETVRYISYDALIPNRVFCSLRGLSYYNCVPNTTANPYQRGCDTMSGCARY